MQAYCNLSQGGFDEHVHAYLLECVRRDIAAILDITGA